MSAGLPKPPDQMAPMLPSTTLDGSGAVVIGAGLLADAALGALGALGAIVTQLAADDPAALEAEIKGSDADILVVCAASDQPCRSEDVGLDGWQEGPGRELAAAFAATSAFGRRRDSGGVVLFLVDPAAVLGGAGVSATAAAGAALVNLAQSLAVEWAPRDIRANALAVGPFAGKDVPARAGNVPALRLGETRELAWMIGYLCSPFAAYVTGTCVTIDGGDSLRRYLLEPRYQAGEFLLGSAVRTDSGRTDQG
jgi:NAD(P)-dependent dehydrogenase (short-subunit alcohol dehydrogenase family)